MLTDHDQSLEAGLYFVATPIGTARDITLRALDVLKTADVLAAEDTRNTRRLLDIHAIALNGRPLLAYHDHNGQRQRPRLLAMIRAGKSVACVSDAGTPLIADPGYALAKEVIEAGLKIHTAPGASALLSALTLAGLPTDRFFFAGFPPTRSAARRKMLRSLENIPGSLVFYESPKRVHKTLADLVQELGGDRESAVCRELTKKFEEVRRGTLAELAREYEDATPRGEIVVVVGPAPERTISDDSLDTMLTEARKGGNSLRDAVDSVAENLGVSRKRVYRRALDLEKKT